ncbi:uncharacterized protein V1518DRAFT_415664 [Limtongia smithiae]|uniref:uncharacterized protein n=1 Tax=Limtongia smithiae TaxID=1125753 RepID=UPI0034CF7CA1
MAADTPLVSTTEVLLETFSNPSLTPTAYLNSVLPSYKPSSMPLQQLHNDTVTLLSSLDHATQELIAKLERVVTEMLSSATRLKYEVELLAGDVEVLDTTITTDLKPVVDSKIAPKSPAMQRLEMLEVVRKRLVEVINTFERAKKIDADIRDGGGDTEEGIRLLLAQGKFKLANDEVEKLRSDIEVWKGTPEYSQKQEFVGKLRKLVQETISRTESSSTASAGDSQASTPVFGRSPVPPSIAAFDRQDYPNVRASAEYIRQEAREGYLGLIESLKKIRQS